MLTASFFISGAQNYIKTADCLISLFNIPELAFAEVSKDSTNVTGGFGYNIHESGSQDDLLKNE